MSDPVFYLDAVPAAGSVATLDGDEGFHAASVRRIRVGERIVLGDGAGVLADCIVDAVEKRALQATVVERRLVPAPTPSVTVVQAIPKAERSELAIELATEAGADAFVAWQATRCVARWDGPKADKGLRRWRAVARSAARQSRRAFIPEVDGVASTAEVVGSLGGVTLALHESATVPLANIDVAQTDSITLVVGPEGGLTDAELAALVDAGAQAVRLGPTVLRTSTAAAVALGALGVLTPRWDPA
ncbi:ribosomal RNA small subunit methyltransferase E [Mycolicibacterium murale]|uniref:Ribosomal RNA small subunit methyltransferase E n=1 Tax=Mycolicibacterium murale TaxID=182220 RepID=A0A7I9WKW8_9MYCO|nr:16S rRNA (uracil(1498)-N(3))-methyltransferase [Mycolicibacterium murale]MCV7184801.1 16S rRNA (uracil(1498)-N(3))-methyltransferase [Mycolicibacterium murale]GFG58395.1 ribosomal RNA small subunit methyltransferase E [Mycolicibacterium murale]